MPETTQLYSRYREENRADEVNELISYHPHWIIRKGNFVFFLLLLSLLALSWFIRYPDVINGSVRLVAINAPKLLTAHTEGKLEKLLVTNEQQVKQGQVLAYLQSTGRHEQVIALQQWINTVEPGVANGELDILTQNPLPLFSELGEVQAAYQDFQNTFQETLQLLTNGYYQKKKEALLQDLQNFTAIDGAVQRQQQLLQQDVELQQNEFQVKEILAKEKIIAPLELNQDKSKVIAKKQTIEQLTTQAINNNISKHGKRKEILELQKYITDQYQKFRSALLNLKSDVSAWRQQFIVEAPVPGKILFVSFLQEKQQLTNNQELFFIQPEQSRYYGELTAAQQGMAKIKKGQQVFIRIASYPSDEFGYITGKIGYISALPTRRDSFLIQVDLPKELRTNYGQPVLFRNNLAAQAEVVTDDRRLINRFFGNIKQTLRR